MGNLLFTNVELYDGTGKPPFRADVAVQDDKVAAIAPSGSLTRTGSTVVDGGGRALVPGFVDVHTHSDAASFRIPGADSKIAQGVTTDISGNCGSSFYLAGAKDAPDELKNVYGNFRAFCERCLLQYDVAAWPVGVVGGFGKAARALFEPVAASYGIRISGFQDDIIDSLVQYHYER